jgi:hypothetical protein
VTNQVTPTPWTPITFDLTWVPDGFSTSFQRAEIRETLGPVKRYFNGAYSRESTAVSGTWDGHTLTNGFGALDDSKNNTIDREIIVEPNP